ncbi:MAG: sarcosine oxidase subunit alpha family protein [Pseudomonadales bacterium]|nr:sarcosine oxidase subunit alpha family protein [Pseudomonadales bacterium]MCP5183911.1 sarcosine oxidase subunit alpha family protein [Pseudomonadales bacterium]
MNQVHRLEQGGRIDRTRQLRFVFANQALEGHPGDTLASALLANGVRIVGRSFKYRRPRGIVAAGMEEPNALVQLGAGAATVPNILATQAELYDGLLARPVTGWPSARLDLLSVISAFGPLLPPGFYNKTFMWPRHGWRFYERFIRAMAGFGKAPREADPDVYVKLNHHCDVLIVGAGPAGIAAALSAMRAGARILLLDEQAEAGGSLLGESGSVDGRPVAEWLSNALAQLQGSDRVTLLTRTTAFGYYDHNFVAALERRSDHLGLVATTGARQILHRIHAGRVILATGAFERLPVFANNDRPGVMLASAVSTYIHRYAVVPGRRLVLFATADRAYQTAIDWLDAGREVIAIVDPRPAAAPLAGGMENRLLDVLARRNVQLLRGHVVTEVLGRDRVRGVRIAPVSDDFRALGGRARDLPCDVLAASSGWSPVIHLSCHTGGRPRWDAGKLAFLPAARPDCLTAGAVNAIWERQACVEDGYRAGETAVARVGEQETAAARVGEQETAAARVPRVTLANATASTSVEAAPEQAALFLVPHRLPVSRAPAQFVDFQNDVTAAAIRLAVREGYESIEHVKRYTALGFGTDQGKLGNINGVALLAEALGKSIAETGTTMFRPAYTPVAFGALAGRDVGALFDPERVTPLHDWHLEQGAVFENVGQWTRPWYYPRAGESLDDAVHRECLAVRRGVGLLDASTLGKIDVQGPDAGEFLDRIYTNRLSNLGIGRCRYAMLLKEDGMVFDDGVVARIGQNRYLATTTTGGAAAVLRWMELWLQTEWPDLRVWLTSVTDQWATIVVTGPDSRQVLSRLCQDTALDRDAFPFMTWRSGTVAGVSARIMRISFTGELSFEINVPAEQARTVWEACYEAGRAFDITPYGTETMHVLRAEKGFVIIGQDTDGSVTPIDLGMPWILNQRKPFSFPGKRSLARSDTSRPDRKQWVGLLTVDPAKRLPEGGQLVDAPDGEPPVTMLGHVTSSYLSPVLGRTIALGFVTSGHQRLGETVYCRTANGEAIPVTVAPTVFFDPEGERQNV